MSVDRRTRVGVVGLGIMGRPMARRLLAAGFPVTVHNRSQGAVRALAELGARPAADPAGVAAGSDVVITMLPADAEVEQVVLGSGGVLSAASAGSVLVDMSTVAPATARRVAAAAADHGVSFVDAPVSGGEEGAVEGRLSIMAGGSAEAFERVGPVLGVLGSTVLHVGPSGAGQTVKAANQLLVGGLIALLGEAIVLLEAHGVATPPALRVLAGGLAGNRVLELRGADMLARRFQPGGRADLHHKDLLIALDVARDAGVSLPATAAVQQLFAALRAAGGGGLDHTGLLTIIARLSGRS